MASTTISGSTGNSYIGASLSLSSSANSAANQSTISFSLSLSRTNTYTGTPTSSTGCSFSVYIDGSLAGSSSGGFTVPNNGSVTVCSGSTTVRHGSDGTKTVSVSFSGSMPNCSVGSVSGSGSFTLDRIIVIPPVTAASITNAVNVTLGNNCSISWRPDTSCTYTLDFSLGSWKYSATGISSYSSYYTYTGYTIPLEVANQLPNATTGTMSVTLTTYKGSSNIGSSRSSFTVTVPESIVPTMGTLTATINNDNNPELKDTGLAVVGYTRIQLKATASGAYGSTIQSFVITGGYDTTQTGASLNYLGGVITTSGSKAFTVVAKDSRGRLSKPKSTDPIVFQLYTGPRIREFSVARNSLDLKKMDVHFRCAHSTPGQEGTIIATLYYKPSSDTRWTTYGTIPITADLTLPVTFSEILSYNFRVVAVDAMKQTAQDETLVSTIDVLMDFRPGGKGMAIGKISESDSLEISLNTTFFAAIYLQDGMERITLEEYIRRIATEIAENMIPKVDPEDPSTEETGRSGT